MEVNIRIEWRKEHYGAWTETKRPPRFITAWVQGCEVVLDFDPYTDLTGWREEIGIGNCWLWFLIPPQANRSEKCHRVECDDAPPFFDCDQRNRYRYGDEDWMMFDGTYFNRAISLSRYVYQNLLRCDTILRELQKAGVVIA